jgi:UDP-N-acetylmuramate--alanine ligase
VTGPHTDGDDPGTDEGGGAATGIGDPGTLRRIHVVGVGGAGMSAIATVLRAMGHEVSGSDLRASAVTERLTSLGVDVTVGHDAAAVGDAGLVTLSTAVASSNPEVVEARRRGIPVLNRAQTLAAIAGRRRCLAVAGTHGKTTTASMLSLILVEAGLRPSFLIGGEVNEIGTNAVWDTGDWIVVEADESDGTFLHLTPDIAIVTNVEADHLDHYGSFDAVRRAFAEFLGASGHTVVGGDDAEALQIGRRAGAVIVGTGAGSTYTMTSVETGRSSVSFDLVGPDGRLVVPLRVAVPGLHNARNAAVATVAALAAGAPPDAAARALARFGGVARRFEFRGEQGGVTFVDDYAHLPTEVRAALAAARNGDWDRVVAVFQPHRYSRTAEVGAAFGDAFADADVVVVTDVYGAGEAPVPGVSGRTVADAVRRSRPDVEIHYVPGRAELVAAVAGLMRPGDLCLTLGAGDLTSLPDEVIAHGVGPGRSSGGGPSAGSDA